VIDVAIAAKAVLSAVGMMALQGTVLALLALVLVRGKLRPTWQAAVWTIVIVKFVLPWGPALPWSLADVLASLRGNAAGGPIVVGAPAGPIDAAAGQVSFAWIVLGVGWAAGVAVVLARAVVRSRRVVLAARRA